MEIELLSPSEVELIISALKKDGFQHIENMGNFISFQDKLGFRTFELYSNQKSGLSVSLNIETILAKLYMEKTRYSQSLKNQLEASDNDNIEESIEILEWELVNVADTTRNIDWTHDMDSDIFFIVLINEISHIVVNHSVYQGEIDSLEALGKTPIYQIIKDSNLENILS